MAHIKKFNFDSFESELFAAAQAATKNEMEYYSIQEIRDCFLDDYSREEDILKIKKYVLREFPHLINIFNKYYIKYISENKNIKIVDPVDYFIKLMSEESSDINYFNAYLKCELNNLKKRYENTEELLLVILEEACIDEPDKINEEIHRYFL